MEFLVFVGMVIGAIMIMTWRKASVIQGASDKELMDELKRRAYARKMKAEADAEVENAVGREVAGGNIPY
jgi:hypothetical protein